MRRGEEALQRALVAHLRAHLPAPWIVFHVPNGGGRSKAEAGALKAMGVLAGMPDLLLIGPGPRVLAIELKTPSARLKSGKLSKAAPRISPEQSAMIVRLSACGVETIVARDLETALAGVRAFGAPMPGRAA